MKYEIVKYSHDQHYEILKEWWKAMTWPAPPKRLLPRKGLLAYYEGEPVSAGFVYCSAVDSSFTVIDWIVVNNKAAARHQIFGLDAVISKLKEHAIESGSDMILHLNAMPSMIKRFQKKHDFLIGEKRTTTLIFPINKEFNPDFMKD